MKKILFLGIILLLSALQACSHTAGFKAHRKMDSLSSGSAKIPNRPADALSGSALFSLIENLKFSEREPIIKNELLKGNIPEFLRNMYRINSVQPDSLGIMHEIALEVMPDYLAIGSNEDFVRIPMGPQTAQHIADAFNCILPTRKLVNIINANSSIQIEPVTYYPVGNTNELVTTFYKHNREIEALLSAAGAKTGSLLAGGLKKDIVITNQLITKPNKVAIYGWHKPDGKPIQPLYTGHVNWYVDYSHGVRLVNSVVWVDGNETTVQRLLSDPVLYKLISDEAGIMLQPRYYNSAEKVPIPGFIKSPYFDEQVMSIRYNPEVTVELNAPSLESFDPLKKVKLIIYALPNGNTIDHTIGKKIQPADDWHFDIQHIGAQTRFLREHNNDENIIVAYLQTDGKSWPAWRRKFPGHTSIIKGIVDSLRNMFRQFDTRIVLNGHSGGGSFIFGFLNSVDTIPGFIERIGFLDSDYAYDDSLKHGDKLVNWLNSSDPKYLCVIAYNDSLVSFNGKPLVSPTGGTWYRSKLMQTYLAQYFNFNRISDSSLIIYSSLNSRIKFLFKENPKGEIFHTVQVERNGFIESILSGTLLEGKGYKYFGERAYTKWIK